jgi:hypothetical protein
LSIPEPSALVSVLIGASVLLAALVRKAIFTTTV